MRIILVIVIVGLAGAVGCKHDGGDPCAGAYDHLAQLGVYGGDDYGVSAIGFGTGCRDLTHDDLACLGKTSSRSDLAGCPHAAEVSAAAIGRLNTQAHGGKPLDAATATEMKDAVCACKEVGCLVGVGERHRDAVLAFADDQDPSDPAAVAVVERLGDCIVRLSEQIRRAGAGR